jgi:methylated-DNA-[protein]-cysteine S-methyltransferase
VPQLRGQPRAPADSPRAALSANVRLLRDDIESPIGTISIVVGDGRLVALEFGESSARMETMVAARYGGARPALQRDPFGVSWRIEAYLTGDLDALETIEVDPGGTPFQRLVWTALRRVPAGRTITYAEMARAIGRPTAQRAVGAANGRNPVSIAIPCHRMVGTDGMLTGYGGGLARKQWLLQHEGASVRQPAGARRPGVRPASRVLG